MDLIDRYVGSVKAWLPRDQRADVGSEILEHLRSEVEAREGEIGRPLTEVELATILERWGSPLGVASRYLPERSLIGPVLFPVFRRVVTIVVFCVLLPIFAAVCATSAIESSAWAAATLSAVGGFCQAALYALGLIVLTFAVVERVHARALTVDAWLVTPPWPLTDRDRVSRAGAFLELAFSLLFLSWWSGIVHTPGLPDGSTLVALLTGWQPVFLPLAGLLVAWVVVSAIHVIRPWWTLGTALVSAASGIGALAVAVFVVQSGADRWTRSPMVAVVVAVSIGICIRDIPRVIRIARAQRLRV